MEVLILTHLSTIYFSKPKIFEYQNKKNILPPSVTNHMKTRKNIPYFEETASHLGINTPLF